MFLINSRLLKTLTKNTRNFATQSISGRNLKISINFDENCQSVLKLPFVTPVHRIHHNFANHFKKQIFANSFLKDPFAEKSVNVLRTHLPFFAFNLSATDIKVIPPKNVEGSSFSIPSFKKGPESKFFQLFSGDLSKFTRKELLNFKLDDFSEIIRNSESTSSKEMVHEVLLSKEVAANTAILNFVHYLEFHLKEHLVKIKGKKAKFSDYTFSLELDIKYSLYYLPSYFLIFGFWGTTQRVVVNGVNGQTCGPQIFSPLRVAIATFGAIFLYVFFTAPRFNAVSDIIDRCFNLSPIAAVVGLLVCYYKLRSAFSSRISRAATENSYNELFKEARNHQKTNFYHNWFINQNEKEEKYHDWFRAQAFEDHRRSSERTSSTDYSEHFSARREREKTWEPPQHTRKRPLYASLGLKPFASKKEVEKAFRGLTKVWHPDKFISKPEADRRRAEIKFNDIMRAYEVLKDDIKRNHYDRTGESD